MYQQLIYNGIFVKLDTGLDVLLSLDGTEYTEENGYWYKIEVSQVVPTHERPHGIRYNLTFHDNYNQRILGFDNAHAVKSSDRRRYTGAMTTYDHVHKSIKGKGKPYEFISAHQLLNDFLKEVNSILDELDDGGREV